MKVYPNYRVSVEIVLQKAGKVLLTKRSEDAAVAPGLWSVPAGKVKYEETPLEALFREAQEEIGLDVTLEQEMGCRAFTIKSGNEDAYRLVFTYLVKAESLDEFALNDEHSEYAWVDIEEIGLPKYASLLPELRELIVGKALSK